MARTEKENSSGFAKTKRKLGFGNLNIWIGKVNKFFFYFGRQGQLQKKLGQLDPVLIDPKG